MNIDLQLKVQAWADGELPDHEARRIGDLIARDAEASALAAELGGLRQAMLKNEAPCAVGESREFYWSKIQRQIEREAVSPRAGAAPWYAAWRRYIGPLAGAAALASALVVAVNQSMSPAADEFSSTGAGMEAVTFHDQSEHMTVVWLQDQGAPAPEEALPPGSRFEDEPGTVIDL
jgi:anti-sigma factor RsiW